MGNSPGPVNSPHEGPVTRKMFPFHDVIITVHHEKDWDLTHWSRVTLTCVSELGHHWLSAVRCQTITGTSAGLLLNTPRGTNFSGIRMKMEEFFIQENENSRLKKWRPFGSGPNVLMSKEAECVKYKYLCLLWTVHHGVKLHIYVSSK